MLKLHGISVSNYVTIDWDIRREVPGFAEFVVAMDERDSTKSVVADNDKALAALMKQREAANQ